MDDREALGARGEEHVALELTAQGYAIVGRNLRVGGVELDLVASKGRDLLVVECKTVRAAALPDRPLSPVQTRRLQGACRVLPRAIGQPRSSVRLLLALVRFGSDSPLELRFFEVPADGMLPD